MTASNDVIASNDVTAGNAVTSARTVEVDLPPDVFDVQVNIPLIHQVVVAQLAAARQGTHATKTRGDVSGGGRKPYRQKGTGRARSGSTRAPQYRGGGVVHGPQPRNYAQRTPKKMKAAALRGALSDRAREGRVHVVAGLVEGDVPSTKAAVRTLAALTERKNVLIVVERADSVTEKSLRNLENVHLLWPDQLNAYDVLVSDDVVFTQGAYEEFLAGPVASPRKRGVSVTVLFEDDAADDTATDDTAADDTATDADVIDLPVIDESSVDEGPVDESPVEEETS